MSYSQSVVQDQYHINMTVSPEERERCIERLFRTLDNSQSGTLDTDALLEAFREQYNPLPSSEESIDALVSEISSQKNGYFSYDEFKEYITNIEDRIALSFKTLDQNNDGKLDFNEIRDGLVALGMDANDERIELFFNLLDTDTDGYISYDEWLRFLLFVPLDTSYDIPLRAAYEFFIDELDLSAEGDFFVSSETLNGIGYFLAGGLAGVISRTCTAPFDRLKVYLIASSGQPLQTTTTSTGGSIGKTVTKEAISSASKSREAGPLVRAFKHLWSQGGIRAFFVGNGLNVIKVFPESAMKFGSFEAAKRFFAQIEGVEDTSEISRLSTFISGGLGGVVAQFTVYPIDTLKLYVRIL